MKISRVVWMMVLGFSMSVIAAAQGPQGPPVGVDPVNCTGCVGTTDIADGAVAATKVRSADLGHRQFGSVHQGRWRLVDA